MPRKIKAKQGEVVAFKPIIRGQNKLEVRNEGDTSEIVLLGSVGGSWWDDSGITEKEFRDALKTIPKGKPVTVSINSEGGSVQEGLGIYNAIKERSQDVTAKIAGYALSIASVIPLAASKVVSPKSAIWMIHNAWSWAQGNAADMEHAAKMLKAHDETLVDIYAENTGKTKDEIRQAMSDETWIKGGEAVDWGLADESDMEMMEEMTGEDEDGDNEEGESQMSYRDLPKGYLDRCKNVAPAILNLFAGKSGTKPTASESSQTPNDPANTLPAAVGGENTPNPPAANSRAQEEQIVNKKLIVALLKKHGIGASETETEEQLQAKLEQIPTQPENKNDGLTGEIAALRQQIEADKAQRKAENEARIKAKAESYVELGKITKDEVEIWVDAMLKDEAKATAKLDAKASIEAAAIPFGRIEVGAENHIDALFSEKNSAKRAQNMRSEWESLVQEAQARDSRGEKYRQNRFNTRDSRGMPVNANTYTSTLVTAFLIDGAVTKLQNRLAALSAFSRDFSPDRYKPKSTGHLKYVATGSTTLTNTTNFEASDSTVNDATFTMAQYTQPFGVSNDELNSGLRLENLMKVNAAAIGNKIIEVATADITEANFANYSGGSYVSAPSAFGWSDMALLWGALKKADEKYAILDGEYVGQLLNAPTFFQQGLSGTNGENASRFGWDGIYTNTDWTGAGTGCRGFVCHPQAIGAVAGLPLTPTQVGSPIPGGTLMESTMVVPGVDLSIAVYQWFSLSSRTMYCSYDVMLGAGKIDTTAGVFVKAA